ncbi:MAG: response regulator [Acidobacteriota bacterium]
MHAGTSKLEALAVRLVGRQATLGLSSSQRLQALLAGMTSILGALAAATTVAFAWSTFPLFLRAAALTSALCFLSVLPLYRLVVARSPHLALTVNNLVPAALFLSCGTAALAMGGQLPLASIYAPAIPVLSVMICTVRATYLWSGLMVTALGAGIAFGPLVDTPAPPRWLSLVGGITVLIPTLLSMLIHRRVWSEALANERRTAAQLHRQHNEQRALDKRLSEHERNESLSLMAGRVAHDLNNFLTAISGNAALARLELEDVRTDNALRHLGAVEAAARAAEQLSRNLLDYTGKQKLTLQEVPLHDRLQTSIVLAQASLEGGSKISLEVDGEVWIEGDPTQIDQVIVNLVRNADQSYAEEDLARARNFVDVRLDLLVSEAIACEQPETGLPAGSYARLRISDGGRGIPRETRDRIFDPFFTDREQGKGLGLASVLGIVEAHGGGIQIESESGYGTEITVLLPASAGSERERPREETPSSAEHAGGQLLIVDDQDAVREVVGRMAERLGFDVAAAHDGDEALELADELDHYAAAIVDVAMPRRDGYSVLEALRERNPSFPVILISGYSTERERDRQTNDPHMRFLQKPFSAEALSQTLDALGVTLRRQVPSEN